MMKQTVSWVDIPVYDLDRAIVFYEKLLDAPVQKRSEHGFEFGLLPHEGENVSGCLCMMEDRKPSQDGLLVYFNVEGRLNQAVEVARAMNATILHEPAQIGPYGHRAVLLDSEGNAIALYSKEGSQ